ncbi:hypothetical protein OG729_01615 [Streptomyces sp. NBC_00210]|uniref:hypothetical protein n=1 Tax=unclassified Streptomyces TaxID=2593676 RepID=UPI0032518289
MDLAAELPAMAKTAQPADQPTSDREKWLTPGVRGIGTAGFLADVGHEIPGPEEHRNENRR